MRKALLLASLCFVVTSVSAAPTPVTLAFHLMDFSRVSPRDETFLLEGYLVASWKEAAASGRGLASGTKLPRVEFTNVLGNVHTRDERFHVDDSGTATWTFRFSGQFSSPLELRHFPFDRQTFYIVVEPAGDRGFDFVPVLAAKPSTREPATFLSEWALGDMGAQVIEDSSEVKGKLPRVLFSIAAERKGFFYLWRVILPLLVLVFTSWMAFFLDPKQLMPQIGPASAVLLSVVTFSFAVDFALPKVSYMTFIDALVLAAFLFCASTIFLVAVVHRRLERNGLEAALALQRRIRLCYPAAYGASLLGQLLYFLR